MRSVLKVFDFGCSREGMPCECGEKWGYFGWGAAENKVGRALMAG